MKKYTIYSTRQDYEKAYATLSELETTLGLTLDWKKIKTTNFDALQVSIDLLKRQVKPVEASEKPKTERIKPNVKLIGADSNVFSMLGLCTKALKEGGQYEAAKELTDKVFAAPSYDKALSIMMEYVEPV